ncbi:MAG: bifunctional UDP-N-acetylglucosamine diphosphorylase/glucosamine-1-phosphate N-acetyltransferase GlmU [Anaerolineales bacterium]|nr:bifunctional UDP-N-acetylglucosamine diphosphorylase/glucosamine-1-phosphate N-acetyltransferase GlmU [Anaerolineales bacterium]
MKCEAVILAAGLGTRMKSSLPKVLHSLGGKPLIAWSYQTCLRATGSSPNIIIGPEAGAVRDMVCDAHFIVQEDRLGTGHAVMQAASELKGKADLILVVNADLPLFRVESLQGLIEVQKKNPGPVSLLTAHSEIKRGFGRIIRDEDKRIVGIVEQAHATPRQLDIRELNVGGYCFNADWLWEQLPALPLSPKGEYYLTDLISMAASARLEIGSASVLTLDEMIGINNRQHLAEAETALRARINVEWMEKGISMQDPATVYIDPAVIIGMDTVILPNTHIMGKTTIGEACILGPNSIIRDSRIGHHCEVRLSVIEEAVLEDHVDIGPFSHLRKGAHLCEGVHMGNFGEVKNSTLKSQAKMGHFSYIGDTVVGAGANIGAGTVTCNYDGANKHKTIIGDGAFIGSGTMLVAPVEIGERATTGAGAVVTHNVPPEALVAGVPARELRKKKDREHNA